MKSKYKLLLDAIDDFKMQKISFLEIKPWLLGCGIGYELNYEKDWGNDLDSWLEYIEFCYPKEDWYELGMSLVQFMEHAIINEPQPLKLPKNDRVIREKFNLKNKP